MRNENKMAGREKLKNKLILENIINSENTLIRHHKNPIKRCIFKNILCN